MVTRASRVPCANPLLSKLEQTRPFAEGAPKEVLNLMADGDGNSAGVSIVAIIAILVIVLLVGYFVLRGGLFRGSSVPSKVDVNVQTK